MIEELGYTNEDAHKQRPISTPQEKALPQIAFLNGDNWGIIARHTRHTGIGLDKMPAVTCPIVDTSRIDQTSFDKIKRRHIEPAGVISMPILLATLIGAGGQVLNSKRAA